MARATKKRKSETAPQTPLRTLMHEHLDALRTRGCSEHTVESRRAYIGFFLAWAYEHGLHEPTEIARPVLERYQRCLFFYRKKNGEPLTFRSQHSRLVPLRVWFKWMTRQNHILHNPASEIGLPRLGRVLPKNILSIAEIEQVMLQPNLTDPLGLRDRAILSAAILAEFQLGDNFWWVASHEGKMYDFRLQNARHEYSAIRSTYHDKENHNPCHFLLRRSSTPNLLNSAGRQRCSKLEPGRSNDR